MFAIRSEPPVKLALSRMRRPGGLIAEVSHWSHTYGAAMRPNRGVVREPALGYSGRCVALPLRMRNTTYETRCDCATRSGFARRFAAPGHGAARRKGARGVHAGFGHAAAVPLRCRGAPCDSGAAARAERRGARGGARVVEHAGRRRAAGASFLDGVAYGARERLPG